ncbi:MAG: hypothetical protein NXI25_19880 [bacterium]|nr:hypothetical protein [bacterium]
MKTQTLTFDAQQKTETKVNFKKAAVCAACLSFFPLVYFLGKWVMSLG